MNLVKCPTCNTRIEWSEKYPFRPFCSERCKLIDLGAWADNTYAIPSKEPLYDDFTPDDTDNSKDEP